MRQVTKYGYAHHEVIAIRLNEIVTCYRRRIQMMLTKRTQKVLEIDFKYNSLVKARVHSNSYLPNYG